MSPLLPTLSVNAVPTLRGAWFRVAVTLTVVGPALSESVDGSTDSTTLVETVSSSVTVTATEAAVTVP